MCGACRAAGYQTLGPVYPRCPLRAVDLTGSALRPLRTAAHKHSTHGILTQCAIPDAFAADVHGGADAAGAATRPHTFAAKSAPLVYGPPVRKLTIAAFASDDSTGSGLSSGLPAVLILSAVAVADWLILPYTVVCGRGLKRSRGGRASAFCATIAALGRYLECHNRRRQWPEVIGVQSANFAFAGQHCPDPANVVFDDQTVQLLRCPRVFADRPQCVPN